MKPYLLAIAVLALAGPCKGSNQTSLQAGTFEGEGIIHQGVGPECPNVWRITTTDGRMLWPVENADFHVEGLRVHFAAREKADVASTCMAGTIVEVISLRRL
jgi:hypothetical protein